LIDDLAIVMIMQLNWVIANILKCQFVISITCAEALWRRFALFKKEKQSNLSFRR